MPLELWFWRPGPAMPVGVGSEPATHARPSPPDWANDVGMRGSVCRRIHRRVFLAISANAESPDPSSAGGGERAGQGGAGGGRTLGPG